jgi:transcriptional regulator with XRE-family HTH domain
MKKQKKVKDKVEYWQPYSDIILESSLARSMNNLSQGDVAKIMGTTQSAISRFENMGDRLPSYDFIANLSFALNHKPAITLFGDYMARVSIEKHKIIDEIANFEKITNKELVQKLLNTAIEMKERKYNAISKVFATSDISDASPAVKEPNINAASKMFSIATNNTMEKRANAWPIAI